MTAALKKYPDVLTSYDFLKTLAVITMVIDHVGYYFFPEQMGWRLVGRLSFPIWLFLVGFAHSREINSLLIGGGIALLISSLVVGQALFPLNILFTIIVVRLVIDSVMQVALLSFQSMAMIMLACIIMSIPTTFLFEYGTHAILFAMFGYMVRRQSQISFASSNKTSFSNEAILIFMGVTMLSYTLVQKIGMNFTMMEFYVLNAGVLGICLYLSFFQRLKYTEETAKIPRPVVWFFKFGGRRTLEIYVVHLLLFKVAALAMFPARFGLFEWSWF